jgi:transcription antitermination factor NusG
MPAQEMAIGPGSGPWRWEQGSGRACWYAVHSRSNFERRVAGELASKGFESYLPAYAEIHRWKDRQKKVEVPLFPGYVFVRFPDLPHLRLPVLQTTGVVRILGHNGMIETVPDEEIEAVRSLLNSKTPCFAHPFLREGVRVRVKRGALKDLEGALVRIKNQDRLVISVSLIAQSIAAEVNIRDVEPVGARPSRQFAA